MREAVIVSAVRTPVGKAPKGVLKDVRPEDLAALAVQGALARVPAIAPEEVEDVIIGCAFPEAEQGMNLGRIVAQRAGLPYSACGMTVNRFCSSGLQSIAIAAERVMTGFADRLIAGGVESMSTIPMGGTKIAPNPYLMEHMPEAYMAMGITAENVAARFGVSREEQDLFALKSHQKAAQAQAEGRFIEEITPVTFTKRWVDEAGKLQERDVFFEKDEGVRGDTSLEALGRLRPAFRENGTVTAGNSSQISDGASAVLVTSREKAEQQGLPILGAFRSFAIGGVPAEIMGIGPVEAIPKALKLAGIGQDEVDLFELNEAFAAQALYVIRHLGIDPERVNVNGGAIALGHPLGCTGSKLTTTLLYEMKRRQARFGVVSMCIGGGMGAAAVFERF
ncbi:acetyl-CoA C-acyltransferase [Heliobacterium gestii]|uniref:Acetyl-CoA acetyltransferase n=1 Tax=Heliomicrobium gestii TaxID=2699 RepID=A0A845LJP3_HELGE|nr:acetyl-CoA C-acyltransferase [Heliomicrobium gestii]MBM7867367.1 acetyl-CoA acyltransferase [Heliomicrobium gestii]MZP43633.1 acetyl-CoA C-acyltransferase [Heliomicrobium gestii]